MTILNELKKEIQQKDREINAKKKFVITCEQAWFKDNTKDGVCDKCWRTTNLTVDHIIPKDVIKSFGIDPTHFFWERNLRLLCKPCNMFKSNRLDFSTPKTKELLLILLERV